MRLFFLIISASLILLSCQNPKQKQTDTWNERIEETLELVQLQTKHGNILLYLYPETPIHKEAFLNLVKDGYFNDQEFNRVIDGFVIQGGMPDPTDYSNGGLWEDTSMFIAPEFHTHLKHIPGALGGGRDNNAKLMTNPCQFYIVDSTDRDLSRLDMKYTIFGHVIDGMEVVTQISEVECNEQNYPLEKLPIQTKIIHLTKEEIKNKYNFDI